MRRTVLAVVAVVATLAGGVLGACGRGAGGGAGAATVRDGRGTVVRVVDGDTVRVHIGGREEPVRLIGIDTPETHGQGGLRECFGKEATARTQALLPAGSSVSLVRDVEARDRYGRLLAYVYDESGSFVNLRLVEEGYAVPLTFPPNVAHSDAFRRAAATARAGNRGLWSSCGGADTPVPSPP
ncbi:MAG TPA: thermonuclease family protein [Acidimicrobiales bacterium]